MVPAFSKRDGPTRMTVLRGLDGDTDIRILAEEILEDVDGDEAASSPFILCCLRICTFC